MWRPDSGPHPCVIFKLYSRGGIFLPPPCFRASVFIFRDSLIIQGMITSYGMVYEHNAVVWGSKLRHHIQKSDGAVFHGFTHVRNVTL